jgi:Na+-driven multidrug efflux pump
MQAIGSVASYCMNRILIVFTSTATAVYGVFFKVQSFVFMPVFGLNNGMIPIIGYNFGAQKRKRIISTEKLSLLIAEIITVCGFIIFQLLPKQLLGLFDASEDMLAIGIPALRRVAICMLFAGFGINSSAIFQALGNGVYSAIVSFMRQIIALLPVAYLFAKLGDLNLVWWAFPIAETASFIASIILLILINRKVVSKIPDNP